MTYSAKLVRGSAYLDLNDGSYSLGADFVPPGVLETAFLSGGTSSNRYRGADLVGTRAENRSWAFSVRCIGSVSAETHSLASRLASFLAGASDTRQEKTYFEYRPDADLPEPVWGTFGQALRYEVVHATTALDTVYTRGRINRNAVVVMVNLTIKPYAQGRPIVTAVASGGILEDRIGVEDGSSRGLVVEKPATNYIKNPIFGHGTPMNGWTATTVTAAVNWQNRLFGSFSVMLSGAAGQFRATTAIIGATGDHVLSCYAKRVDGQPVTAADLKLSFNAALLTTTFQAMGDGWYRLYAVVAIGALVSFPCGIDTLANGVAAYVTGFQFEPGTLPSSVCWGDMLGCAWSGTAHDSSSTRLKGNVLLTGKALSDKPVSDKGTIRVSLIFNGSVSYCFSKSTGSAFRAYIQNNAVLFENGAVSLSPAIAPVLVRGDVVTVHFTWNRTTLAIYLNGVLLNTASGTVTNIIDVFNIGSHFTNNFDSHTILDFAIYDQVLTGPQVASDYARVKPLKDAKLNISRVPWVHVKDTSTMALQNCLDATRRNYAVISGVPGSAEAMAGFFLYGMNLWTEVLLSCYDTENFVNPSLLYADFNTNAEANSSGGGVDPYTVSAAWVGGGLNLSSIALEALLGKNIYVLGRLGGVGNNVSIRATYILNDLIKTSAEKPLPYDVDYRYYLTHPIYLPKTDMPSYMQNGAGTIGLEMYRSSGSANINLDFLEVFPGKLLKITTITSSTYSIFLQGNQANNIYLTSYFSLVNPLPVTGDDLTLAPDSYSVLTVSYMLNSAITKTIQLYYLEIIPRWHLL